jgi:hypothetical protein
MPCAVLDRSSSAGIRSSDDGLKGKACFLCFATKAVAVAKRARNDARDGLGGTLGRVGSSVSVMALTACSLTTAGAPRTLRKRTRGLGEGGGREEGSPGGERGGGPRPGMGMVGEGGDEVPELMLVPVTLVAASPESIQPRLGHVSAPCVVESHLAHLCVTVMDALFFLSMV